MGRLEEEEQEGFIHNRLGIEGSTYSKNDIAANVPAAWPGLSSLYAILHSHLETARALKSHIKYSPGRRGIMSTS
jgi:hypothetical protein